MYSKEQEKINILIQYLKYVYVTIHNKQPIFAEKNKNHNDTVWKNTRLLVTHDDLSKYYNEAKNTYQCLISGLDFHKFSTLICANPSAHFNRQNKYYPFYDWHNVEYRQKLGFVKNYAKLQENKNLNSSKQDWRIHKKIKKDKSKKHYNRGLNSKIKRDTHQAYRANIKQLIRNEKFDQIFEEKEKWFLDPWDWD